MKLQQRLFSLLFCIIFTQIIQAQIVDNFSDGNFDQNPSWSGDAANFKVNASGELQLNASGAGQSTLLVSGNLPDSCIWDFEVRLGFDPSGSNLVRVYLQADQADLTLANGYYIEMGETGSADAIRFYRIDAGVKTQLALGQPGLAASSPNLHIRVKRTASGVWSLDAATVGAALQSQFSLGDATWKGANALIFGFQCVYTSSNATKYFFDNINIHPDIPDTQAPSLLSAQASDATHVLAQYDEELESTSAENKVNYSINNGIGQPLSAVLSADKKQVTLTLANALITGNYTLQSSGLKDLAGNASSAQTTDFEYINIESASEFDIVINEIMANPNGSVGLPEVEWLELYNRSGKIIDLSKLRLSDATGTPIALPVYLMQPGEYLGLAALANASALQAATTGKVLAVAISSSMLNNDGDLLTLSDASGNVIDRVNYSIDWHTVPGKENGGFSLERINPDLPCLGSINWQSCPAQAGGTPAAQNASYANTPDTERPRLFKVFPESVTTLTLSFSEGMDRGSAEDASAYQLEPAIIVSEAVQDDNDRSIVRLTLASPLQSSTLYLLSIGSSVKDCSSNAFELIDSIFFGIPEKPEVQDIVINEILFNPATGGSRYVEFYNRSQKIFNWSDFYLASNSDTSSSVVKILQDRLFLPGEYHVFSSNAEYVRDHYANIIRKNVLQNNLPSLDDIVDSIKIYWAGGGKTLTIDSFLYYRGLHNGLLSTSEQEGVAIERIRVDGPTQSASNWTSASSLITGAPGTPTLPNSQRISTQNASEDLISIPVPRLSPDEDTREDFLEIFYKLPREGYAASMTVFDSDGNPVKTLVKQTLIGTEGVVRWDGDTDAGTGTKARPGIYVLYFEIFNPQGEVKRVKKAVALVGKF